MSNSSRALYVGLYKKEGTYTGHVISSKIPLERDAPNEAIATPSSVEAHATQSVGFSEVFESFALIMGTYRSFIPLTLGFAPLISVVMAEKTLADFVKERGEELADSSTDSIEVYELDFQCYRQIQQKSDEIASLMGGSRHLPEVMIIGLISVYDAFLTKLLRAIFAKCPKMVLTPEKNITYSDLEKFGSIDAAKAFLIEKEVEGVIRLSHHEQFYRMEKLFGIPLTKDLAVWPEFIELCERRNLLTHNGGYVSQQYVTNCKAEGCQLSDISLGQKLEIDRTYYSKAVQIIYEIGVKLCYVLWRKFEESEHEEANSSINELAYDLIVWREYKVAEALLMFSVTTSRISKDNDKLRRMMVVNLANAIRLQGRAVEANEILDREDWSSTKESFEICVAAVKGDIERVVGLMKKIGVASYPSAEDYRTWPVFRGLRTNDKIIATFEEIFGQPLILKKTPPIDNPALDPGDSNNVIELKPDRPD